ncbi:unnamed protein product [Toxocara canis]|uniref:Uncharacterized protein n=1 Tax=Toxocara canis TaxID=6265 RepID=A0A183UC97_TOXCA|nr:unnamed protein product [Toxocara canis]
MITATETSDANCPKGHAHYYTYKIVPIRGRESTQKTFISLPEKTSEYENRFVTLNERFSIVERGTMHIVMFITL